MPAPVPRFLITAAPRAGKTTFACALGRELSGSGVAVGGFLTPQIKEQDERAGFEVTDFDGHRAVMAHAAWTAGCRVGRYHVDVTAFDRIAIPAITRALSTAEVIIIDEIGQMELCSAAFTATIDRIFSAGIPVAATIHAAPHPVTDALRERPGTELRELSAANRDQLRTQLLARLRPRRPRQPPR